MSAVLLDSDVLIEVARGRDRGIVARWRSLAAAESALAVTPVTIAELWHGARPGEEAVLEDLFAGMTCVPLDAEVGRIAGAFLHRWHGSHGLELADALIAATAVMYALPLWTRSRRRYPMPELKLYAA